MDIRIRLGRWHGILSRLAGYAQPVPAMLTRLAMGWLFFESGLGKFGNLEGVADYFASLGILLPHLQAPFVAAVELVGGLLLLLGLGTRGAALLLAGTMAVALLTEYSAYLGAEKTWSELFGLAETVYLLLFTWLIVHGAGCWSLDRVIVHWLDRAPPAIPDAA